MKTFTRLVFVIAAFVFPVLNVDAAWSKEALKDNFKNIHSKTPLAIQQEAATDVIARLLPDHWNLFQIQLTSELPVNSFQLLKRDNDTVVRIMASSGVAACKGFHHYFKNYLGGHTSWSGNRIPTIPKVLPSIDMHSSSASLFIYHQNVCTWSYSYAWWKWPDWQKHIDWMAFMGISLTLAPIQEEIWTRVYRNIGLTDNEIDAHFAGPGFQAWQRMGNMRGWVGPLSSTYKRQQLELQKKIIKAQQNLGMSVAMAAFAGHVPVAFRRLYPNTTLTPVECWNNFPEDYCCPLFIDPEQDIFGTIGSAFLREAIKEYGTDHIYFSDPFNEINPHSNDPAYLAKTSQNIYNAMKNVDPEAIWLLQGWMFINSELFWKQELIKAFLTAVPLGRILVLDLQSELAPQYERTNSYYGQPFIWCMLHNFGGTLGMHGSAEIVNTRIALTRNMTNSTMIGVGITMEGINQNYVMYEFALDRGWWFVNFDEKDWFDMFSASRYGMAETNVTKTNDLLRASVYAYRGLEKLHGKYTICGRPSIKLKPWSWYDHNVLESAWTSLLYANHLHKSALYRHDLVDITRQFLQIKADEIYVNIIEAYAAKNLTVLQELSKDMIDIFVDLEKILKTSPQFLLGNWLTAAKSLATSDLEELLYEINARNQITTWGPDSQINDYANKQWSGMMVDYYMPRWKMFLNALELSLKFNRPYNEKKFRIEVFRDIENPFTYDRKIYENQSKGCAVQVAFEIHDRWTNYKNKKYLIKSVPIR